MLDNGGGISVVSHAVVALEEELGEGAFLVPFLSDRVRGVPTRVGLAEMVMHCEKKQFLAEERFFVRQQRVKWYYGVFSYEDDDDNNTHNLLNCDFFL